MQIVARMKGLRPNFLHSRLRMCGFCVSARPDTQNVENMTQIGTRRIFNAEHDQCKKIKLTCIINITDYYSS